jgi:hypothetical protein
LNCKTPLRVQSKRARAGHHVGPSRTPPELHPIKPIRTVIMWSAGKVARWGVLAILVLVCLDWIAIQVEEYMEDFNDDIPLVRH